MLSKQDIIILIEKGENSSVEFKNGRVNSESIAKEFVAFSNSKGGVLLIGVSDNAEITGIDISKNYEELITNLARNNIIPPINVQFAYESFDNKKIAVINIEKGKDKPYQTKDNKFIIRVGTTNRTASQAELMRLFQASGAFHFDITGVNATSISDLNFSMIDNYFGRYDIDFSAENQDDKINMLINSEILTDNNEVTIVGLLVFGLNPSKYLYQNGISFAHFKGEEITDELIDKQNIDGTLSYQIDTGLAVIKNNILNSSKIIKTKRESTCALYPDKVFKELLTNACIHRNYAISGSKIRILMFNNRIEFISPGRLPNTITLQKLTTGVSYAINPAIVKFMENLRYIDKLGRGLPMVYKEAQKLNKKVEFEEIGEDFKVTLSLAKIKN